MNVADGGKFGFEIDVIDGKAIVNVKTLSDELKKLEKTGTGAGAKVGSSFTDMAKSFAAAAAGSVVLMKAWSGLKSLADQSIKNAFAQVDANAKLQFQFGENAAALEAQANALQLTTRFGDDSIESAQFALGTYKLSAEAVGKLTPIMLDYAQSTGGDASAAVSMLGKAMNGNVMMLQRMGIKLTEAQKGILATGTEMERAAMLADLLSERFGGVAEMMGKTVPGAVIIAKNAWQEYLESQGMAFAESERVRVGLAAVARELLGAANAADGSQEVVDDLSLAFANMAVSVVEAINPMVKWGGVLKNVTDMAITISTLNFGDVFELPASVKSDWAEMQTFLSSDFGKGAADSARKIRDEMAAVARGTKAEKLTRITGGNVPGEDAASAAEKEAQRALEVEEALYGGSFARIRDMRIENDEMALASAQSFAERASTFELESRLETIRQWESAFTPSVTSMAEFAGNAWMSMTSAVGQGMADLIVDGTADAEAIAKGLAKELISSLTSLAIQIPMWMLIRSAANTVSTGIVAGYTAALIPLAAQVAMWKSIEYSASVASLGTAQAAGAGSTALSGALGLGGGLGGLFHQGGMIDRYHSGGMIYAHSGMFVPKRRDEVDIRALSGEAVLNRETAARLGGRSGINRLNRGGGVGSNISITVNAAPGMSENALADKVVDKLMRASRRGQIVLNARGIEQ